MTEHELMLTAILDCERTGLYIDELVLTAAQAGILERMQKRRALNEPLQYILGQTEFFGFKFKVDPRVLIPRPETELLVEHILQLAAQNHGKHLRILDIGTGSGNIAISLAKSLNEAHVIAMDFSVDALSVARDNARLNQVAHRIDFVHCDFFEFTENYREAQNHFDIIVSNPPYIATPFLVDLPADVKQEPSLALDGGEGGLKFLRVLTAEAKYFLKQGGCLVCEIGDGQKENLNSLLAGNGFRDFYFRNDFRDTPRFFVAQV